MFRTTGLDILRGGSGMWKSIYYNHVPTYHTWFVHCIIYDCDIVKNKLVLNDAYKHHAINKPKKVSTCSHFDFDCSFELQFNERNIKKVSITQETLIYFFVVIIMNGVIWMEICIPQSRHKITHKIRWINWHATLRRGERQKKNGRRTGDFVRGFRERVNPTFKRTKIKV